MKIIVAGATGLLGKKICSKLIDRGDEVVVFSRSINSAKEKIPNASKYVLWDYKSQSWYEELDRADGVIHLAGENVMAKRWNETHKKNILQSRINGTGSLVNAFASIKEKPKVFICASAVGFYGNSDLPVDENSKAGNDFLAGVVQKWEESAAEVEKYSVRRVSVRVGIVLDKNEGALLPFLNTYKFFLGGPIGNGEQWFPWIHIDDVVNIFLFTLDNKNINSVVNACSTNIVKMNEFAKTLGKVLKRPSFFRVPEFILRLVLGESADVVLTSANVQAAKIENLGYEFLHKNLEDALKNILTK